MIRKYLFAERYPGDLFRIEIEEPDLKKSETQNRLSTSVPISNKEKDSLVIRVPSELRKNKMREVTK